jgi:hypothetical protein
MLRSLSLSPAFEGVWYVLVVGGPGNGYGVLDWLLTRGRTMGTRYMYLHYRHKRG